MTQLVAIASGKGGVGKTTLAINMALALNHVGRDVVVLDANLAAPNVSLHLGKTTLPATIHDVLSGRKQIRDALYTHQPSGLRVIPGSIKQSDNIMLPHDRVTALPTLLHGLSQYVFLDTPPGRDGARVVAMADKLIAVSTPDMPAVIDTLKTIRHAKEKGVNVLGVVLNKTGSRHELSAKNVQALLGVPVLGSIPFDESVLAALKSRHPFMFSHNDSPAAYAVRQLAQKLVSKPGNST